MNKFFLLSMLVFYPTHAFAYIDPGTVSIILQGLIGAIAATIVTLKIYWYKIIKFFNSVKKKINKKNKKT